MQANYYMGQNIGKKRSDQSPFYAINILAMNRFGSLDVVPLFVTDQQYHDILDKQFRPGDPVIVNVSFTGVFNDLSIDTRYAPLELDAPAKPKDNK